VVRHEKKRSRAEGFLYHRRKEEVGEDFGVGEGKRVQENRAPAGL